MSDPLCQAGFLAILREELIPAMGCTEPIALAYAAARLRGVLGKEPDTLLARCSGNIIKNVRCVQIPHSGGLCGIESAVALGFFGGDPERNMEVLAPAGLQRLTFSIHAYKTAILRRQLHIGTILRTSLDTGFC